MFEVGDKVKVVGDEYYKAEVGRQGIIEEVEPRTIFPYRILLDGDGWSKLFRDSELQKIEEGGKEMKKDMQYSLKVVTAITDSIKHHEENLHKLKMLKGDFKKECFYFKIEGKEIDYSADSCALCREFIDNCPNCPLTLNGLKCDEDNSPWKRLQRSTTQEQAIIAEEGMVRALESLMEKEVEMNEYDELKHEINRLTEWGQKADDIMLKLYEKTDLRFWIESYGGSGCVVIVTHGACLDSIARGDNIGNTKLRADFSFHNQCSKLEAFKKALMWLLDNSNIKKDEKKEKIEALETQVKNIQRQIAELK